MNKDSSRRLRMVCPKSRLVDDASKKIKLRKSLEATYFVSALKSPKRIKFSQIEARKSILASLNGHRRWPFWTVK